MGRHQNRNQRRRQRTLHIPRGVHNYDQITFDLAACRELLDGDQPMDEVERLLLELAVRHGGEPRRFLEYKKMAFAAIIEAGSIDAATDALSRVRHRLQHHHPLPHRGSNPRAL